MGWTWEVEAWARIDTGGYQWFTTWTGESFIGALRAMREAKKNVGAVRLIWR